MARRERNGTQPTGASRHDSNISPRPWLRRQWVTVRRISTRCWPRKVRLGRECRGDAAYCGDCRARTASTGLLDRALSSVENLEHGPDHKARDVNVLTDLLVKGLKRFHYDDIRGIENGLLHQATVLNLVFHRSIRSACDA
jgi:hypothetical protein